MRKLVLACLLLVAISLNSFAHETVKLATGEWSPFTSESNPKGQIAETIIKESFNLENIAVEFLYYPWKRSYAYAKKG